MCELSKYICGKIEFDAFYCSKMNVVGNDAKDIKNDCKANIREKCHTRSQ